MAIYTMIQEGNTQTRHMFKRDLFTIDTEQFEQGYVAYTIQTNGNDIIIEDSWNSSNIGEKFNEAYSNLEIHDSFYLPSYIENLTKEQLLTLADDHGYEEVEEFSDKELKEIFLRL